MYSYRIVIFVFILVCHFNYLAFAKDSSEKLNSAEKKVIEQVKKGEFADFSEVLEENRILSADFLKELLTGAFLDLEVTEKGIQIVGAQIKEKLDFRDAKIPFSVSLKSCIFDKDIDFYQTTFSGKAIFWRTEFSGAATFEGAKFSREATFEESKFSGRASFDHAIFSREASFWRTEFSGVASLRVAKFSWAATFDEAKFAERASFDHAKFFEYASFKSAKFFGEASLRWANFSGETQFFEAVFSGVANFDGSKFFGKAYFSHVEFFGMAFFYEAEFNEVAIFRMTKFSGKAYFEKAKFSWKPSFEDAKFSGEAIFRNAEFSRSATFEGAKFSGISSFRNTNLRKANLRNADLSKADLSETNLSSADLSETNLSETNLSGADLTETNLSETNLKKSLLWDVSGFPPNYEPKAGSPPYIPSIANLPNLSQMTFKKSPHGLVDLREGFKKLGYRKQEREITYAINHTQRLKLWNDKGSGFRNKIESLFYYLFFEITCKYGMNPGRPLTLLIPLIIIFAIPYTIVLKFPPGKDGIWKIWIPERARKDLGAKDPYRLNLKLYPALGFGIYFSILSAFSIGWRELNIGNWIARIQRREYTLRATGWVRTVSGIQSLISVYLVALWVLSYFGRPFEGI